MTDSELMQLSEQVGLALKARILPEAPPGLNAGL